VQLYRVFRIGFKACSLKPEIQKDEEERQRRKLWNKYRLLMMGQLLGLDALRLLRVRASSDRATARP
jgi:hypothetical protein